MSIFEPPLAAYVKLALSITEFMDSWVGTDVEKVGRGKLIIVSKASTFVSRTTAQLERLLRYLHLLVGNTQA